MSPTLDLLCHEDFNVGRSEISGQQSPNSSMEIIFILSGKYKIFTFVNFLSARVTRHFKNHIVYLLHESMVEVFF